MPNAVLDANVLVSAAIASSTQSTPRAALARLRQDYRICLSAPIEAEYRAVLLRPKFRRFGLTPALVGEIVDGLAIDALRLRPSLRVTDCRDPKDAIYLEAALAGGASLILSGDADLLALHPWRGIAILAPASFLAR